MNDSAKAEPSARFAPVRKAPQSPAFDQRTFNVPPSGARKFHAKQFHAC